jgi:hypothetical protein
MSRSIIGQPPREASHPLATSSRREVASIEAHLVIAGILFAIHECGHTLTERVEHRQPHVRTRGETVAKWPRNESCRASGMDAEEASEPLLGVA